MTVPADVIAHPTHAGMKHRLDQLDRDHARLLNQMETELYGPPRTFDYDQKTAA